MSADIKSENLFLAVLRVVGQDALRIVFPPPVVALFLPKKLNHPDEFLGSAGAGAGAGVAVAAAAGAGVAAAAAVVTAASVGEAPLPVKL